MTASSKHGAMLDRLLGWLNRVWLKDPLDSLALRLTCDGSDLKFVIRDGILTTTPVGGTAAPLEVDLASYTISTLGFFLAAQPGYQVIYQDSGDLAQLSALALRDQVGDVNTSNGDHLWAFTNANWAVVGAYARELVSAEAAIRQMLLQMAIPTAGGEWLDLQGSYYAVPRLLGETDVSYAARIIPQVLLPKGNNVAIANIVSATFGQPVQVVDVLDYTNAQPHRDGSFSYDGSKTHSNTGATPVYGLFDISIGQDILGSGNPLPASAVRAVVEMVRDAGTQLRAISGTPSLLSDTAPPSTGDAAALTMRRTVRHDGTFRRSATVDRSGTLISAESLLG